MTFSLFFLLWAPVLGWAALIFYLSSIPSLNSGLGIWDTFLRKGAHIFEFAVLTGLLLRALRRTCATIAQKNLLLTAGGEDGEVPLARAKIDFAIRDQW